MNPQRNNKWLIGLILILTVLVRLPSLWQPHLENDEVIYLTLTKKVAKNLSLYDYNLKGTELLSKLPEKHYNSPLFLHPPVFVLLTAIIYQLESETLLLLIPIIAGLVAVYCVYLIGKEIYSKKVGLIAALILSLDSIFLLTTTKFWIDGLLSALFCLSLTVTIKLERKNLIRNSILIGVLTGLTILTKYPGILLIPIISWWICIKNWKLINKITTQMIICLIILLVVAPWWRFTYQVTGNIWPLIGKPIKELQVAFPFLAMVVNRPFHYYLSQLLFISPLLFIGLINQTVKIKKYFNFECVWGFVVIGAMMIYGVFWQAGYQMRFIAPALPALAIIAGKVNWFKNNWTMGLLFSLLIFGFTLGLMNVYIYHTADIFSWWYLLHL